MKDIKTGTVCIIIIMVSATITFLWGFLGNAWNISWVAVMIGGMLSCIVYMIRRDKEEGNNDNQ